MKVLAVYTPQATAHCQKALLSLDSLDLDIDAYEASTFSGLNESGILLLESHTHFLAVFGDSDCHNTWFSLLTGYALGSRKPLFLIKPEDLDPGNKDYGFLNELFPSENVYTFFAAEKSRFLFEEDIRRAKEQLARSGIGFTSEAFCESVAEGELRAVELFLKAGFNPDARNKNGVPAICLAIRGQHRSVVTVLRDAGVDIDVVSADRGNTPLMEAAALGDDDCIRLLIKGGAELNSTSKNGQTALILAVGQKNENTALILLEAGADPGIKDSLGMTAAQYASLFGKKKVLERLS